MNYKAALLSFLTVTVVSTLLETPCRAGQDIVGESGQTFMEETTPPPPATSQQKRVPIDLSNVGVPVDEKGRIVPLIDRSAPDGVRRNFSNFESYSTAPVIAVPAYPYFSPWSNPYGYRASYGYGSPYGYRSPYGYGSPFGYGSHYGYGIPLGYGSPYGYGRNGFGFNLGKFRVNLGTPGYGYSGMYGASPWGLVGNPYGYSSPWSYGNPYRFGNASAWGNPYAQTGGFGLNPFANRYQSFGKPFNNPYSYVPTGGIFGPSPFPIYSSPLLGSSLFTGSTGGLGLSIFTPPKIEWQSTGSITPITPNLDTTDQP